MKATDFQLELALIGQSISGSLERVITAVGGQTYGPQQLAAMLDIDKGSASRLLKAIRSRDPLGATHLIPGPEPLRRLLRSARKLGVNEESISEAEACVERFQNLILASAGDRTTFDGLVSTFLPEARVQHESRVKQLLHRGCCQLKGYCVDVDFSAIFIHPAPEGDALDYGVLSGMLGVRRLRPYATVRLVARLVGDEPVPWQRTTLEGVPLNHTVVGRLDRFCTAPTAEVVIEEAGDTVSTVLAGNSFGPLSPVDLVLGHRNRLPASLYSDGDAVELSGAGVEVDKPTKLLHFDIFLHKSVYAGSEPELIMTDTAFRGMANMNDPSRAPDHVELAERIEPLGFGLDRARASHIAHYSEMLHYLVDKCCWDPSSFRGYRCMIEYPLYGTQVTIGFARPIRPDSISPSKPR